MGGISWLAANQLASQEGLCTMEQVSKILRYVYMTVQKELHWNFSRVHRFTNSILSSVHPSFLPLVRTKMLGSNWTNFRELHIKLQCRIYNCHVYAVSSLCLQPLASWDCGFEFHREHGCLSFVNIVCCQVEVCVSGWSLVRRSPIEFGFSGPLGFVTP